MPPKRTPNPRATDDRDLEALLLAVADKLAADDPAWRAGLDDRAVAALDRLEGRRGTPPGNPGP